MLDVKIVLDYSMYCYHRLTTFIHNFAISFCHECYVYLLPALSLYTLRINPTLYESQSPA